MQMTVTALADRLRTEGDAYRYLEELRWGDAQPACLHCGSEDTTFIVPKNGHSRKTRTGAASERRVWRCRSCRRQFSVLTGTIFHGTKVSIRTWVFVVFEISSSKNGVSAREIERKYGVCCRTAWFMLHRIREAMTNDGLLQTMRGTIVADETWIGGDPKNLHEKQRRAVRPYHPGMNVRTDKTPVLSLINAETGEARSRVVPNVTGAVLRKVMSENVDIPASVLHTDSGPQYKVLGQEFAFHGAVNHADGEYVRDGISTNKAENFFSQLKRSLDGTHHHVSREHLDRYLAEFDYRYSTRKMSDTARMERLVGQVGGKRLTYKLVKA
jgi:transposase-like protein